MIKQTIHPRVDTEISAISKNYRFNGGVATVQIDSYGNYEVLVNGKRFSSLENSAKRDPGYMSSVNDVSLQMVTAFEKRDAKYTAMHKNAIRVQKLDDCLKSIVELSPRQYEREQFPYSRPMREDVRRELEQEASIRYMDLYDDMQKERATFVNENEKEALRIRLQAYEEVQSFFNDIQEGKAAIANAIFQQEYEQQKKEIEDFIAGEPHSTEKKIKSILEELAMPYRVEISCDYNQTQSRLNTDIELYGDMHIPTTKTHILTSGKISIKDRLIKEIEQFRTETIISMVYYVAASLFNASINIQKQCVTVWLDGKYEGILSVMFGRERFAKLSMRTVRPVVDYYDWPRVDALRVVRGALQLDTLDSVSFVRSIQNHLNNNINSPIE